ncbi:MAG: hypothetical protein DMG35_12425 [Acidobacteria bacterium]|nr:MAG: hypothetical protein AUH86_09670 [Acidobacteria bacterium 13_1_40CM_4_58_4]PYT60112.1 MAG: hypothetical protein DMG35_12425 [Acidobacteriota bacterium]
MLSIPHMIVVFIVVLVVFGPQKLPELARGLGKLMAEFRKASTDFKTAFEEEMRDLERQALLAERKKAADAAAGEPIQPATIATASGAETPSSEGPAEPRGTEAPVISPVAESVARSGEESADIKAEAAAPTESEESRHDA